VVATMRSRKVARALRFAVAFAVCAWAEHFTPVAGISPANPKDSLTAVATPYENKDAQQQWQRSEPTAISCSSGCDLGRVLPFVAH
jgi:hypothetical protein